MIKYLLKPGKLIAADGREVEIHARQLARLYGVPMSQCAIWDKFTTSSHGLIELRPRSDGRYQLPVTVTDGL